QAEIPADELVIVLRLAPVHAQHANSFGEVLATCQHHARVAQRSEVLAREERQAPKIAQCASSTAVTILGSDRLSGVLDDGDAMLRSDLEDRSHLCALPEEVDGDDRARPRSDRPLDSAGIYVVGHWMD